MPRSKAANGAGIQPREKKDGRWEARYRVGIDPGTGKTIFRSVYGKTKKECGQKLRTAIAEIEAGTYLEPKKMRLKEWMEIWLDEYCADIKERTRNTYRSAVNTHIIPKLGAIPLCDLQPHQVQKFINSMSSGSKAVSPKTVKNVHGILHRALKKAVQVKYIRENAADNCNLPRVERQEVNYLTRDELKRFLQAIAGHRFEAMFLVAVFTGIREGELLGLCWDSIDFARGTIRIKRQLQLIQGEYKLLTTKNSKPRTISPPEFIMNVLQARKKAQLEQQLKAGPMWNNPDGYVFSDEMGKHIATNTLYMNFKRAIEAAGIAKNVRFHDLRHTYAAFSLENGDNMKEIQEALGHYSCAFTMDTYAHISPNALKESAARKDTAIRALQM